MAPIGIDPGIDLGIDPVLVLVVAGGWPTLVLAAAWRFRPQPVRLRRLRALAPDRTANSVSVRGSSRRMLSGWPAIERVGRLVLDHGGHRASPATARRIGMVIVLGIAAAPLNVLLAILLAVAAWFLPELADRRDRRRRRALITGELPDIVDLLLLTVKSGLTVSLAVGHVGRRGSGLLAAELARASHQAGVGRRLADALEELAAPDRAGEPVRSLVGALVASERYGAPLAPALERLAVEVRADRRRMAEEAARKVPVKLLFPLVTCTLPAFALLTVAPLIASALKSLRP